LFAWLILVSQSPQQGLDQNFRVGRFRDDDSAILGIAGGPVPAVENERDIGLFQPVAQSIAIHRTCSTILLHMREGFGESRL